MLYDVTPSSEVTGGAWYTDQELDTDFIETLAVTCYKYIYSRVRIYVGWRVYLFPVTDDFRLLFTELSKGQKHYI